MARRQRIRYEERPTRFASGVSAVMLVGFLAIGLPILAVVWAVYASTEFPLLLIPLAFMLIWNEAALFGLIYNVYNVLTGKAPATTEYERIEEIDDEA